MAPEGQTIPHVPQLAALELRSTQLDPQRVSVPQPLTQRPIAESHTGLAPEHTVPHAPQFIALSSDASQPFAALPSQSPKPLRHVYAQRPIAQFTVEFVRPAHTIPHAPQLFASVVVSMHAPPQRICPEGHAATTSGCELTSGCDPTSIGATTSGSAVTSGCAATSSPGTTTIESIALSLPLASRSRVGTVVHANDSSDTAARREAFDLKRIDAVYPRRRSVRRTDCGRRTIRALLLP